MTTIRSERSADHAAIDAVIASAFHGAVHASGAEGAIVGALRGAGQLTLSLVADEAGQVVGHVAVSPVTVDGALRGWYGLGPVAVAPPAQRRGIGRMLVERALDGLRERGAAGCVVLGDPAYYARFGFVPALSLVLPGVPPAYFQALAFDGAIASGEVAYHPAFRATG